MTDSGTGATYYVGDFTPFNTPGSYYIAVPSLTIANGMAKSATFRIAPGRLPLGHHVRHARPLRPALRDRRQHQHQRPELVAQGLPRRTTPLRRSSTAVMSDTIKPSLHGWHDAGDYGKYTTNGAFTVGMMLTACEHFQPTLSTLPLPIPEKGGAIPGFSGRGEVGARLAADHAGHRRLGVVQGHRPELRAVRACPRRTGRGATTRPSARRRRPTSPPCWRRRRASTAPTTRPWRTRIWRRLARRTRS